MFSTTKHVGKLVQCSRDSNGTTAHHPSLVSIPLNFTSYHLKCCLINAQSAKNKIAELHCLLATECYHILFLVETWFNETVANALLLHGIPYNVYRRGRGDSRGGGIAIFYKKNVAITNMSVSNNVEALSFTISGKINVILGYIPDGRDKLQIDSMCSFLRASINPKMHNLILGDFNMSYIDWLGHSVHNNLQQIFYDFVTDFGMKQLVSEPTRGNNILDLILVDSDRVIYDTDVEEHFSNSDHNTVVFSINCDYAAVSSVGLWVSVPEKGEL